LRVYEAKGTKKTRPLLFKRGDFYMSALAVDSMQGLSYTTVPAATPSRGTPGPDNAKVDV